MSTIYIDSVNEHCRKYLVKDERKITKQDELLLHWRFKKLKAELFESFLLHDKVNLKVYGENLPLIFLITSLGLKNVEELIERDAISFTLWTPMVGHISTFIEGAIPIVAGRLNSPVHTDPSESIMHGFNWMTKHLDTKTKKMIIRKVRDLYVIPKENLEHDASELTISAFNSNKTSLIGFDSTGLDLFRLNFKQRAELGNCASIILEHKFLMSENFTTGNSSKFSRLYSDSLNTIVKNDIKEFSAEISKLECFPDLYALGMKLSNPLEKLVEIRHSKNSIEFRKWIQTFTNSTDIKEISKAYLDAVMKPIGFSQSDEGEFMKSCIMVSISVYLANLIGPAGLAVGWGAGLALDLIDRFFISELSKGWTPRMFFDDMRTFSDKQNSQT